MSIIQRKKNRKKGAIAHFTDIVIGTVFLIIFVYGVFTYVQIRQDHDRDVINTVTSEKEASRDMLVLMRTPLADGMTVAEHMIKAYYDKTLIDPTLKWPLTQEIYRFFNTYYNSDNMIWNLVVSEEKDGSLEEYHRYNKVIMLPDPNNPSILSTSNPCDYLTKVIATIRLPVKDSKVSSLVLELRRCVL
ncbi:hypothetical protein COV93_03115 [Candidatus Woesearchaeota archaeon CG11_big_fil_rev_8_21_14_0_20_43_8]|nr:MAG: hypothetical protein COV93_03115 [Candidatus Woesearchaeota archaeon CG11_big_fil_rev_8_21_14_0_20_43_8]PIO05142.1 MAG: hypothetical protein COT47_06040 [Candidatus Woesearchaeota archaeon CG08_land_8_20_14_0_20_43_7]